MRVIEREKNYKLKYCDGAKHDKSFVNLSVCLCSEKTERESNSSDYDGVVEGVLEGIIINILVLPLLAIYRLGKC